MANDITLDQLLGEYQRLGVGKEGDGLTTQEWSEKWGINDKLTRVRIKQALKLGWVVVGSKLTMRMDGRPQPNTPCYSFKLPKRKGKR